MSDVKWQPIATAPKDGTWILVSDGVAYWSVQGHWIIPHTVDDVEEPVWWMPFPAVPLEGEGLEDEGGRGGSGMAPPDGTTEPTVLPDGDKGRRCGGCG